MLVSLEWLKDYLAIKMPAGKLAELLTMKAVEVEAVTEPKQFSEYLVIGQILEIEKHPNADMLKIAEVNLGGQKRKIVCGGVNIAVGQKVAVALPGAKVQMTNGSGENEIVEIKEMEIRGEKSAGMICSETELGLSKSANAKDKEILVLPEKAEIGKPVFDFLGKKATTFSLDVLPNRPDLLSHQGVAREIAVLTGEKFNAEAHKLPMEKNNNFDLPIQITEKNLVPRYSAIVVSGLKTTHSPHWLEERLEAVGIRSVNNIVDVTNYIMMDLGQPLHVFDYDKISGHSMIVRLTKNGETLQTLDDKKHQLPNGILVIADRKNLIDLAGIMGGKNTEIDEKTTTVILQAAIFDPVTIRQASVKLNQRTEAVSRYEKGVDATGTIQALAKAFALLQKDQPNIVLENTIDLVNEKPYLQKIDFDPALGERLGGVEVPKTESKRILQSLGMKLKEAGQVWQVEVPSHRPDLTLAEDLVEEVLRVFGYDNIPETLRPFLPNETSLSLDLVTRRKVQQALTKIGFFEVINYSFLGEKELNALGLNAKKHLHLTNPLDARQSILRSELVSGLLRNVKDNLRFQEKFNLFEAGVVYLPEKENQVQEVEMLAGTCVIGKQEKEMGEAFYKAKAALTTLLSALGIKNIAFQEKVFTAVEKSEEYIYHPGRTAEIWAEGIFLGLVSEAHTLALKSFNIKNRVGIFELAIAKLAEVAFKDKRFQSFSKYPPVSLDLAFLASKNTLISEVIDAMMEAGKPLLNQVELFDEYYGKRLPQGKKSLAFHLNFQTFERTLTDKEVNIAREKIISHLRKTWSLSLRKKE